MPTIPFNLSTVDGRSKVIVVGRANKLSAEIEVASGITWSSAILKLEGSVASEGDIDRWHAHPGADQWTSSAKAVFDISVAGMTKVRFITTTAEAGAKGKASIVYLLR